MKKRGKQAEKKMQVTAQVDVLTYCRLYLYAEKYGETMSEAVREAVTTFLDEADIEDEQKGRQGQATEKQIKYIEYLYKRLGVVPAKDIYEPRFTNADADARIKELKKKIADQAQEVFDIIAERKDEDE